MTLAVYKTIKVLTQMLGVGAGIYAMSLGADPMTSLVIVGTILVGPEVLEYSIASENDQED